ncbi:DEAD/DEAH box helicase [Synoicihabitans lomoniglobus]|uniref:DEAD/DEAH box helicase n=1 Tax=Synoicihabitans lomoniglobus TaxID=2909285 RepID=A0AAF0CQC2_9BACT|nr:DEAD/DEAH box helicase [Opitutaceae bacterium LMO-M01]WED66108.1 DEAD/DEAH box helicase [Opitutaceae bacterium LMO-M01]
MQSHGPKRVYTPQSLEFWFEKLADEWEPHFSDQQLEDGHRLYREGDVRELELTDHDAIVHRRVEKKDEYAVIEWKDGKLAVRSSSTDLDIARALAVAGMHEIEELVADEISPLPGDDRKPRADGDGAGDSHGFGNGDRNGHTNGNGVAAGESNGSRSGLTAGSTSSSRRSSKVMAARQASRSLVLVFRTKVGGLSFRAFWQSADKERQPALGAVAHADGNGHVTSGERAKLIGLAAYARKAHFQYSNDTGVYLMANVGEIPNFLQRTLSAWRRLFTIELDNNAANLIKGTRTIKVEAVADRRLVEGEGDGSGHAALDLRWIFKAGEQLLTDAEVRSLLKRNTSPTIIPSVGIVELPAEQLQAIESWRKNVADTHMESELSPYLVFSLFNDSRFKLTVSPALAQWRDSVMRPAPVEAALPELLRPYQRRGVEWLHHLADVGCHGLLADEMGLGKTLQVISLLAARPLVGKPHLVVCPASVVPVWREEIERFFPEMRIDVLKTANDFTTNREPVIWLASYTQLRKHRELLPQAEFGYAILDEGQFIKNPDAKVTQTTFAVRAMHRVVLTGTPLENRQLDLWSIFRFLLPGLLGSRSSFESQLNSNRDGTMERLRAQLAPFILRRTKSEVATELPQKVEMDLLCPMSDVQRAEYARICSEGLQRLGDDVGAAMREKSFGFLALLTRLRQVCCDPDMLPWRKSPLEDSGKIGLLIEKLGEVIESGHKVVIFSQFVMLLDRVKEALTVNYPHLAQFELTGMTLDRQKPVQDFQNGEGAAAMLVSLKAAGTGITLHAADYVFLLDPWWNPAVEAQAVDRVHRIGQTNTVFVYRMVTAGTIEERIQDLKESKKDLFDRIVGGLGGDFDLSQHFTSLQELVTLTQEATEGDAENAENGN